MNGPEGNVIKFLVLWMVFREGGVIWYYYWNPDIQIFLEEVILIIKEIR